MMIIYYLQDTQKLIGKPISSQLAMNNNYINTHYYMQNQLNDKIKDSSIKLSTSYWDSIFESIKLVNSYWSKIFNISNSSSSIA
jgi:hypothetical protein